MTDPIEQIANKLVAAAYENYARAPEPGTRYLDKITARADVPGYFRKMAQLAREPRSADVWQQYHDDVFDIDVEIVMEAGLDRLCDLEALSDAERRAIEKVSAFQNWETRISHERLDRAYQQRGSAVVESIAGKLIEAAYARFGRPPEAGGIYIATVIRTCDVPRYYRMIAALAGEERTQALWDRYEIERGDGDAEMVTNAGLEQMLLSHALPRRERAVIEQVKSFHQWRLEVQHKLDDEANEQAARDAGLQ